MKATEILIQLGKMNDGAREAFIKTVLAADNVPAHLWRFNPVTVTHGANTLVYEVSPDYLSVGEDDDFIRMPAIPLSVNAFMDRHELMLPTKTMVNQIYSQAPQKIRPITWTEMYDKADKKFNRDSNTCYAEMNRRIQALVHEPLGTLTAGHKKDVVLSNGLTHEENKGHVAIYGWFNPDGSVIQGLNFVSHVVTYVDYSHGLRMVKRQCILNGQPTTLDVVGSDHELCHLIHDEPLVFLRY